MSARIIFITRKHGGKGGMQQYARDLERMLMHLYGQSVRSIKPDGTFSPLLFPLRIVWVLLCDVRQGTTVHLGDAALSPLAVLCKVLHPRARVTVTACGLDVIYPRRWYQWILSKSFPSIDHFVAISEATKRELCHRGIDQSRVTVIPCGVWMSDITTTYNLPPFDFAQGKPTTSPRLLTISRLIYRKGVEWFIRSVLPELLKKHPSLVYTIIGDGPQRTSIEEAIGEMRMEEHVELLGEVDDSVRGKCIDSADLLIVPNILAKGDMEGFGITCIEVASRGIPVAAARLEGLQDAVIDGVTGSFFAPGDSEDALSVISACIAHPLNRIQMQKAVHERYDWCTLAKRYDHVFAS